MTIPVPANHAHALCPACQIEAPVVIVKKNHHYYSCPACGCIFTPKLVSEIIVTENNGHSGRHDQNQDATRLQRLLAKLGRPAELLIDFGCGKGETTAFLKSQGVNTIGIDQDTPVQLKDLADASVDGIMMVEVIEHLFDPHTIFQQFNRVLKTGGVVYIESSFADGKNLADWDYLEPAIGHCSLHTLKSMAVLAVQNGFVATWLNSNVCLFSKSAATESSPPQPAFEIAGENVAEPVPSEADAAAVLTFSRIKNEQTSLRPEFLRELARHFGVVSFIETGTYLGDTAAMAAEFISEVHTIELAPELARKAKQRFVAQPQVHVHAGDSAKLLPEILATLRGPALLWLDGHYSEGETARGDSNTPILTELRAVQASGRKDAVILIDDLRLFEKPTGSVEKNSSLHGYPSIQQLHEAVLAIDAEYQFMILGDVALAFPNTGTLTASPVVMGLTISRLFDGQNLSLDEIFEAENIIAQAQGEERAAIQLLPRQHAAVERYGLGLHYRLWNGLTLFGENKFTVAAGEFAAVIALGFKHWRAHWYRAMALVAADQFTPALEILDQLIKRQPNFSPAQTLREKVRAAAPQPLPAMLPPHGAVLPVLQAAGLWRAGQPLRLHLGCGEQHFDGYVNIDYPPSEHSCQTKIGADIFADITKLQFPLQSLDEIRLHHVFEHFKRAEALALLIRWHEMLKVGGRLHLETPDLDGCARQLVSDIPFRVKQVVVRHCFGSQEAGWANHYDGWTAERYQHVLGQLGFSVQTKNWSWPHPPHLANVEAFATKMRNLSRIELLAAADQILSEYMTVDVPSERGMCEVWRKAMRDFLAFNSPAGEVVVKLQGGLGNQMFQYAAGLTLARRNGARLKLDLSFLRDRTPRPNFTQRDFCLDLFTLAADCEIIPDASEAAKRLPNHVEKQFHFDPNFHQLGPEVYLDGYFQSPRFFEPVRDEVLQTFKSFATPLTAEQQAMLENISAVPAVCLNVRRGDYVADPVTNKFHGVCDEAYFHQAVAEMQRRVPGAHFFIFSDDIAWCRSVNLTNGAPCTFMAHEFAGDRFGAYLQLMTACRHFILPNSSFGWWAAFLGEATDKTVIVPDPWFDNPTNNTMDLFPATWIRQPKNRAAAPLVSILIPCHNYAQYLSESVTSAWNQTFRNFEIIVVDDGSTDDSFAVAQRLAAQTPAGISFRVVHIEDSGPTAARRFGVAQARGKYVLPLDADDRIAPDYLAKTVPLLEAKSKLGFVYVDTVFFGDQEQRQHQPEYDFARLCQGNFISYCSLIRKAAFDDVAGYDAENWGYYEDWDLWIRLGAKGWFGQHLAEPLFFYRHHFNSSLSLFAQRLDPVYKAYLFCHRPELYTPAVIASARQTLAEMPPDWNKLPPMRNVEQLQSLLAQHPRNRHVLYFLGCALAKKGDLPEAETVLNNLLTMYPNDQQAQGALQQLAVAPAAPSKPHTAGLVSVIVPTYNRPDWLGETLQSILTQTYREFEIIVVNDAGPDVSHIIAPLNTDGRIQLVTHEKNKGLAGARNTGIRAARGQYIAYLDDDDIFHPQHLATLVEHLKTSGAPVVYSDAHRGTQRKQGDQYVVVERTVPYSVDWDGDKILVHNFIPVLCFLHEKRCIEQAGWFDESLTTHEDWDLWMRMSRLFNFSHIKQVTCEFRWRDDGSSMSSARQADFVRTAKIIYQKNPEFAANRPDIQARRQQFLIELGRPVVGAPAKPTPKNGLVSIIIPVFNKVEFTQKCLARLAAIPGSVPHEIIVVDDCSTDRTEVFCRSQMSVQSNLRYHRLAQNGGFGRACNHGAAQARGQWLVFLNNDTEPEAGWLESSVARLQGDPSIGIVGAKLLYPDRTVQHCGVEFFWADNPDHKIWPLHRHMGVAENDPKANIEGQVAVVTGACLFIPADLFQNIGGFSPEYSMYFEDADLCFKVWQAGRKVFYEPKCVVIHYESQSSPNRERVDALNKESGDIFFKKWPAPLARIAFETCLEKSDGRFNYFRQEVLPLPPAKADAKWLENVAKTLISLFHHVGPFYMHFGGAGDALLLLATFLDKHPDAQVISFANSIPAARSFFEAFPSLKRVWFLPKNEIPQLHILLRMMMRHCPDCLGMGTTPEGDYFKEWHAGLDIFQHYKVSRQPTWPSQFRTQPQTKQVVLAPRGSLCGMVGSKRNIINPSHWPQLIRLIQKNGFQPVIIGTPDESATYPCLEGCEDRRSFSFREQMEHIANSAVLIGADSWAKTFSALAGIPTIVFEPIKGADWAGKKDPSDFIFLEPWKAITVVKNLEQCSQAFSQILKGTKPAKPVEISPATATSVSWEGSFLDHGSLSHVNRELVVELKNISHVQIHCVANGVPMAADGAKLWPEFAKSISTKPAADATLTVRHAWPPNWNRPAKGKLAVIQPWEFGSLPLAWVSRARDVDEFWVPSNYVRDVYIASGVPAEKVFVVPNGVNSEKFNPQATPMRLTTKKKFKFLFVGGTIGRKGPDLLLQAYLKNFTAADDVCLVIKDFGGKSVYAGQTFETQIRASQSQPNAPEILYLNEELAPGQLPGLYTACDCLVLPYRGEGFGLPALEAMACGLPLIVTAGGATDDFVRDEFAWRIPAERKVFGGEVSGMKLVNPGWLLEPNLAMLGETMKTAFGDPAAARMRGQLASRHAQNWSWKNAAAITAKRIQALTVTQAVPVKTLAAASKPLPAVAGIGNLDVARDWFLKRNFEAAWLGVLATILKRPFHPEAYLLLAEIALAAGAGDAAKVCAQRARDFAPGWNLPKQFLSKPLKGDAKPAWLVLPAASEKRQAKSEIKLTVCLIAKNEEKFLAQCLQSVCGLASQIVVLDTGSTDRTLEIAREYGAEVHSLAWSDDFSAARNAALEHATGDWILMLDADEELPAEQHPKLLADLKNSDVIAFRLPLVNRGQENEGRSFVPRLFRNLPGVHFFGRIHEQVFQSLLPSAKKWGLKTALGTAELLHHGYTKEMIRDRNKVERNLKLLRAAVAENPADANLVMNFGLELVRAGDLDGGIVKYREAFELMSAQASADVVPELREALLTQFVCQLYKVRGHEEVVRVLNSPLAKNGGLTASLHFSFGLSQFELKNFTAAAEQMRQVLAKRKQPALTPINLDIHSAAPHHCLALCLARLGDVKGAEKAFNEAILAADRTSEARVDLAKFLAEQGRATEALQTLHAAISADAQCVVAWRLGGEIALADAGFLEFAKDWTGEAFKALPENPVVAAQRAEALMVNGEVAAAAEIWEKIWRSEPDARPLAALILCEAMVAPQTHAPRAGEEESATSVAFIAWYQKLIAVRALAVTDRLNEQLEKLARALPTAAQMLAAALNEAKTQEEHFTAKAPLPIG